jgi:hypothetical protein
MNIALPAIIIFALLLPGFIVRSRFKRAERASLDYSPFGQVVTEAVLWACVLHLVWLSAAYLFLGQRFITEQLFRLLSADPAGQTRAIEWVGKRDVWIAIYFITILAFAYLAPAIARTAIIHWRLDRSQSPIGFLFRFKQAPWYYLLTGADFSEADKPDFISVAAIVDTAGAATLYTGVLEDFFFDEGGALDRLVLSNVSRRQLTSDKVVSLDMEEVNEMRFYAVEGDYFVLRYSEAITLNIQYLKLQEEDSINEESNFVASANGV